MIFRMRNEVLENDNKALKLNAEYCHMKMVEAQQEILVYSETTQKYQESYNKLNDEYHEFKQNTLEADTRLRDMRQYLEDARHRVIELEE